jgi:hypothetical protein
MNVQDIEIKSERLLKKFLKENKINMFSGNYYDCMIGYNEVTTIVHINDTDNIGFIIKRFDDYKYYIGSARELMEQFMSWSTGDIVNLNITLRVPGNINTAQTVSIARTPCITLDNYCPTMEAIEKKLYYEREIKPYNEFYTEQRKDLIWKQIRLNEMTIEKNEGFSPIQFQGLYSKLNIMGKNYLLVDVNTLLIISNNKAIICTMQPHILDKYNKNHCTCYFRQPVDEWKYENKRKYIRNYKVSDIPDNSNFKYLW